MSNRRKHEASTASIEFSGIVSRVDKLSRNRLIPNKSIKSPLHTQRSPSVSSANTPRALKTPKRKASLKYTSVNNGDSPGDGEMLQDIIWDPTSPIGNNRNKDTRQVKISDIVNRLAPKGTKLTKVESPLLQWIGDSAVPCTPEVLPPKVRRRSTRQSSVDDLIKLAKQFDRNMHQQDKETNELRNNPVNNLLKENVSERASGEITPACCMEEPSSRSQQVEQEMHALFDGPTQQISGRLSQGSSASACSQDTKGQSGVSHLTTEGSEVKLNSQGPGHEDEISKGMVVKTDDFDDDWENDDLLNDTLVLEMSSKLLPEVAPKLSSPTNTSLSPNKNELATKSLPHISACGSRSVLSTDQAPIVHPQATISNLAGLCPKSKTTNRSTFKLESNPSLQVKTYATSEVPKTGLTVVNPQPATQRPDQGYSITKPGSIVAGTSDQLVQDSMKDISDKDFKPLLNSESQWDDGDDDDLLYQACDNMEKISDSDPEPLSRLDYPKRCDNNKHKVSTPLPTDKDLSGNPGSYCNYVRSNSAPGTSSAAGNFQGWNIPIKASKHSIVSQSHPGSGVGTGKFTQTRSAPGWGASSHGASATFKHVGNKTIEQPRTVSARNSNSQHASFKRHLSDSATMSNKVFVTSGMAGKCSEAEIERKKQEALARRRLRIQASHNPGEAVLKVE